VRREIYLGCAALLAATGGCSFDASGVGSPDASEASPEVDASDLPPEVDAARLTPGTLVDRELVVRYYIDEVASGTDPDQLLDAAPDPLNLELEYGEAEFVELEGNRGLRWPAAEGDGWATVPVDDTKIRSALDGATAATIEVVLAVGAVSSQGSRFTHLGDDGNLAGHFTLRSRDMSSVELQMQPADASGGSTPTGRWDVDLASEGRLVLHLVVDTEQPEPADRLRLYVNGIETAADDALDPPGLGRAIALPPDRYFTVGNRHSGSRSFEGSLFYAAMYGGALEADGIEQNFELLRERDDSPSRPEDAR
jgi:hypothetical protein